MENVNNDEFRAILVTAALSMMKDREDNVWLVKDAMIKAGLTETLDGIFVANVLDMMKTEGLSSNWKAMEKLVPRARGSGMYVGPLIKTIRKD